MINVTSVAGFDQTCKNFTHLFFCIRFDEKRANSSHFRESQKVRLEEDLGEVGVKPDERVSCGATSVVVESAGHCIVGAVAPLQHALSESGYRTSCGPCSGRD